MSTERFGRAKRKRDAAGRRLCGWCEQPLGPAEFRWCGDECMHQDRIRRDSAYLRQAVFARDGGVCSLCESDTEQIRLALNEALAKLTGDWDAALSFLSEREIPENRTNRYAVARGTEAVLTITSLWDADHIVPVVEGGGQCDIDNLRTLCLDCHAEVTAELHGRLVEARKPKYVRVYTVKRLEPNPASAWSGWLDADQALGALREALLEMPEGSRFEVTVKRMTEQQWDAVPDSREPATGEPTNDGDA